MSKYWSLSTSALAMIRPPSRTCNSNGFRLTPGPGSMCIANRAGFPFGLRTTNSASFCAQQKVSPPKDSKYYHPLPGRMFDAGSNISCPAGTTATRRFGRKYR